MQHTSGSTPSDVAFLLHLTVVFCSSRKLTILEFHLWAVSSHFANGDGLSATSARKFYKTPGCVHQRYPEMNTRNLRCSFLHAQILDMYQTEGNLQKLRLNFERNNIVAKIEMKMKN